MSVHILGIRHHGPGSARSVLAALETIRPRSVLIEGPPDADELIALAGTDGMRPPVALLIYRPDEPKRAVFYPFAEFSPEWQAIRWALTHGVPVRFMDLPQRHRLAEERDESESAPEPDDPMALLAKAAGYTDSERWWEEQFEKRHSGEDAFKASLELMTELRKGNPAPADPAEARREAWMRQTIREEIKSGADPIAVICGAWHSPALAELPPAKHDAEILKGLPKVAVAATWLPWTHRRLTFASGYGAGIHSPGYYEQLWSQKTEAIPTRWMTTVARLLRAEDLEGSTASIIEATRLAEAAAALRGRSVAGLAEFNEAALAVFCFGDETQLKLIRERLIVGDALGTVSEGAPQVPLQRDFQKETKRLRLPPEALDKVIDLDLRKPNDLDRSRLLHRLRLLEVKWGRTEASRGKGTFKETWKLRWEPELEVALIEAAPWGNTIPAAAARYCLHRAEESTSLEDLTKLLQILLLAELPDAVEGVMQRLENQAALTSDVGHLMNALPPLAAAMRYGDVRQTDVSAIGHIVTGLLARIAAGLLPACGSLNDEAAGEMLEKINATQSALSTLAEETLLSTWRETLGRLAADETLHGLISGRGSRVLFDDRILSVEEIDRRLSRHLSRGNPPAHSAAWLEGFLSGSGLILIHQPVLWNLIDGWLCSLSPDHFVEVLPLLRRTFSTFDSPERRQMGELAKRGNSNAPARVTEENIDEERANLLLPTFQALLGQPQNSAS